jgi:hypothetical protein
MRIRIVEEIQKEQLSIDEVVGNSQNEGARPNGAQVDDRKRIGDVEEPTVVLNFSNS